MGNDYKKKLREIDEKLNLQSRENDIYNKVKKYYSIVKKFADKEIEKGKKPIEAIDFVLNDESFNRLYTELAKNNEVKRKIRTILIGTYFNKLKKIEDEVR